MLTTSTTKQTVAMAATCLLICLKTRARVCDFDWIVLHVKPLFSSPSKNTSSIYMSWWNLSLSFKHRSRTRELVPPRFKEKLNHDRPGIMLRVLSKTHLSSSNTQHYTKAHTYTRTRTNAHTSSRWVLLPLLLLLHHKSFWLICNRMLGLLAPIFVTGEIDEGEREREIALHVFRREMRSRGAIKRIGNEREQDQEHTLCYGILMSKALGS